MVQIVGKYLYESGENFDAFLKALDVGFILRNLAKTSKPTIEITLDGDVYTIKTITTLKTTEIKFKLGEEFEETRMDGKTVKVRSCCSNSFSLTIIFHLIITRQPSPRRATPLFRFKRARRKVTKKSRLFASLPTLT